MKVIVIGKGGREHALIDSLSKTEVELFCAPGSHAIAEKAEVINVSSLVDLAEWLRNNPVDLCIAGEESFLVEDEGLRAVCEGLAIPCWGPSKAAAQLEASKAFAKEFMSRHSIPTAQAKLCCSKQEVQQIIGQNYPVVLKFDGLAYGKGVAVCFNREEADAFLNEVFDQRKFGGGNLLVEDYLEGSEISIFAGVSDGDYWLFPPARDYKRLQNQ